MKNYTIFRERRSMQDKKFYTTGEISKLLGISQKTVKNYINQGKISAENTLITNYSRISRTNLEKFISEQGLSIDVLDRNEEKRVLVVDDDPHIVTLISRVLENLSLPVSVETAVNGYEACIKAGIFVPHLITLDIQMPQADGFEVCRNLRSVEGTKSTDIIIVSGNLNEENIARLKPFNIRAFFGKPFGLDTFKEVVEAYFENPRKRREPEIF